MIATGVCILKHFIKLLDNLKKGNIAPVNLFYGPEEYLRQQAIDRYQEVLVAPEMLSLNCDRLDGQEATAEEIAALASAPPMWGSKRLVVVRRAPFFSASGPNKAAAWDFISNPLPTTCLIFETGDKVDRRRKLYREINKSGGAIEFTRLRRPDLIKWIKQLARRCGKNITRPAVELVLGRCGTNMYNIYHEMNKLVSYAGAQDVIGEDDVRVIVTDWGEENIFAVVDALGNQRYNDALDGIRYLLLRKVLPQSILGMLARQVRLIMQAGELAQQGYSFAEINKQMGVHNFVCKKALSQSKNFKPGELVDLLRGMMRVDQDFKTGRQEFYPAVEMLFLSRCIK